MRDGKEGNPILILYGGQEMICSMFNESHTGIVPDWKGGVQLIISSDNKVASISKCSERRSHSFKVQFACEFRVPKRRENDMRLPKFLTTPPLT
jgi:hypothetical protein